MCLGLAAGRLLAEREGLDSEVIPLTYNRQGEKIANKRRHKESFGGRLFPLIDHAD